MAPFYGGISQKFQLLIISTSDGWKVESTLEPPNGFERGPLVWESSTLNTRLLLYNVA